MKCLYCAGAAPSHVSELPERKGINEKILCFDYPDGVETECFRAQIGSVWTVFQAHRLTDLETGTVVEIHDCFDQRTTLFKANGVMPADDDTTRELFGLLRHTFRLEGETRGPTV